VNFGPAEARGRLWQGEALGIVDVLEGGSQEAGSVTVFRAVEARGFAVVGMKCFSFRCLNSERFGDRLLTAFPGLAYFPDRFHRAYALGYLLKPLAGIGAVQA
jgi:hypothetical protein